MWGQQWFCLLLLEVPPALLSCQPLVGFGAAPATLLGAFTCVLGKGRLVDSPQEFLTHFCSCTPGWHFTGLEGFSARSILPVEVRVFCIYFQVFHIYNYCWKLDSQVIYSGNDYTYNV